MEFHSVYNKFLDDFACAHVSDGCMDNDGERMIAHFTKLKGSFRLVLCEVRELKDKGNDLFRQNRFDEAASCYDEACKLFGLSLASVGNEDFHSLSDLAVSLNSNLAACALKLEEFRAAVDLCTMILESFPRNVKALFRRAIAYMKLTKFLEAKMDLMEALGVEPRNKDVLRELEVVKGHLLIKANGKRMLEVISSNEMEENGKKQVHSPVSVQDPESSVTDCESVAMEVTEIEDEVSVKGNVSAYSELAEAVGSGSFNQSFGLEKNGPNKSLFEFTKKGGGHPKLRISGNDYQKLIRGHKVMYYRKNDLSTLTVRICHPKITVKEKSTSELGKKEKEKKKRLSKPRKRKRRGQKKDMSPSDRNTMASKSSVSDTCLSPSYFGDNLSSLTTQDSQACLSVAESLVLENHSSSISTSPLAYTDLNDNRPFCFSASPKKSKISLARNLLRGPFTYTPRRFPTTRQVREKLRTPSFRKIQSQRDESPRHNLSTCPTSRFSSRNVLRPRGVSVSCCRYSSEAQLIKKRKEVFAQLERSDRPLKRPIMCTSPVISFSFSNNVIVSDPTCRVVCMV